MPPNSRCSTSSGYRRVISMAHGHVPPVRGSRYVRTCLGTTVRHEPSRAPVPPCGTAPLIPASFRDGTAVASRAEQQRRLRPAFGVFCFHERLPARSSGLWAGHVEYTAPWRMGGPLFATGLRRWRPAIRHRAVSPVPRAQTIGAARSPVWTSVRGAEPPRKQGSPWRRPSRGSMEGQDRYEASAPSSTSWMRMSCAAAQVLSLRRVEARRLTLVFTHASPDSGFSVFRYSVFRYLLVPSGRC